MRFLVVPFPWKAHVFSLVPLAWSLRTAGPEVRVAGRPDLLDAVASAGLTAVGVGPGETSKVRRRRDRRRTSDLLPRRNGPRSRDSTRCSTCGRTASGWAGSRPAASFDDLVLLQPRRSNDSMVEDLVAGARAWRPDLVLRGAKAFAGAVAAEAVGAVHARVLYSVDACTRLRTDFLHAKALQPPEQRTDAMRGRPADRAGRYGVEFSEDLVGGRFTLAPLPEAFRPDAWPAPLPVQFVPCNGPAVVPGWLAVPPPAPRVLMTFGDSVDDGPARLPLPVERLQEILDSVADLEVELVPALPPDARQELREVPANTRPVGSVPLAEVLPTCSAVVHRGGTWSFGCALRAACPGCRSAGRSTLRRGSGAWRPRVRGSP